MGNIKAGVIATGILSGLVGMGFGISANPFIVGCGIVGLAFVLAWFIFFKIAKGDW